MQNDFVTIREARLKAKKKIRNGTFQWLESGAEDNYTAEKNILDLNSINISPRLLNSESSEFMKFNFFNYENNSPLIVAPMGHQTQFHYLGELELAKGLKTKDNIASFTTQGRHSFEQIKKKYPNIKSIWQIFPFGDLNWIEKQIKIAEKNNAIAISLCLDAPLRSHRYDDRETRYDARKFGSFKSNIISNSSHFFSYDFSIIKKIKNITNLPVIPKGILSEHDLEQCLEYNADGVWLSNHGGRFFNSGISTAYFMKSIQKKLGTLRKKNKIIIADGGIRRGSDIVKYLCLGADLVAIGRPILYGLIVNGHKGVNNIIDILNNEFHNCCINGGFKTIKDFNFSRLVF